MRLIKYGLVTLPEWEARDTIQAGSLSGFVGMGQGAYDTYGSALKLGATKVSRSFELYDDGPSTIQELLDALSAEASRGKRLLQAVTRDGQIRQTWAKITSIRHGYGPGEHGYQPVTIEWEVDYPYWLVREDEPVYLQDGVELDGSWELTSGRVETRNVTSYPHSFIIENDGGAPVPRGWFGFTVNTGTATGLKVENLTNGYWFQYTGSISAGKTLEVDFLLQAVRLDGVPAYGKFYSGDKQDGYMVLDLGSNEIRVTATSPSTSATLNWQWSRHYIV